MVTRQRPGRERRGDRRGRGLGGGGARGWTYYTTPLRVRGYAPPHRAAEADGRSSRTRSGSSACSCCWCRCCTRVRKRWTRLARAGPMRGWLEVHIFCGIVGPALITFHSSLKFNGIISVAYWSMMAVMLSGFVGRYLFVRIPKTIRGTELTHDEIRARADELETRGGRLGVPARAPGAPARGLESALEQAAVCIALGAEAVRRRVRRLRGELQARRASDRAARGARDRGRWPSGRCCSGGWLA